MNKNTANRIAATAAIAGLASATYQAVSEARDRRRYPPPGRMVDIGGRRLHLVTAGEGSPAVVIIPALADSVLLWMRVLEGVAAETHACVSDRAGVGWSDPPPHWRRTPDLMAADLHALLSAAERPAALCPGRPFNRRHRRAPLPCAVSRHGGGDPADRLEPRGSGEAVRRSGLAGGSGLPYHGWRPAASPGYSARDDSPQNSACCGTLTLTLPARSRPSTPMRTAPSCSRPGSGVPWSPR